MLQAGSVPLAQDLPGPVEIHIPQLWTSENLPHLGNLRVQILTEPQSRERRELSQGRGAGKILEPVSPWDVGAHSYRQKCHGATSRGLHSLQVLSLLYFSVISPLFCVIPPLFCVIPPLFCVIPPLFNYYLTKRSLLQFLPLQIFFPLFLFFFSFKIHFLLLRDATICSISCCKQIHIGSGR